MARYNEIISSTKNKKGGNVSVIIADDSTITDPIEIVENFNNFFTSLPYHPYSPLSMQPWIGLCHGIVHIFSPFTTILTQVNRYRP